MSRKSSVDLAKAMKLVRSGRLNPRQAALKIGIAVSTMYRSADYKAWRDQKKQK